MVAHATVSSKLDVLTEETQISVCKKTQRERRTIACSYHLSLLICMPIIIIIIGNVYSALRDSNSRLFTV